MKIVPLVSIVLILLAAEGVFACSCSNPPTIEKSFEQSAAVFYGTVESVKSSDKEMVAVFRVEKSWKGADNDQVIVRTNTTSCGINFREGEVHYLFVDKAGDEYYTVPCRRHGGSQETFLENKPTVVLKSVPLASEPALSETPKTIIRVRGQREGFFGSSLFLIVTSSVISAVFVLLAIGIGFYIFKSRKR